MKPQPKIITVCGIQFELHPNAPPCPIEKAITQYQPLHFSSHSVQYENPLSLSKPAYAVLQNLLSLTFYQNKSRLLDLCLTLPEDLAVLETRKRLNSFLTNVLRRCTISFVRITGRTRKGRIHYHIAKGQPPLSPLAEHHGSGNARFCILHPLRLIQIIMFNSHWMHRDCPGDRLESRSRSVSI